MADDPPTAREALAAQGKELKEKRLAGERALAEERAAAAAKKQREESGFSRSRLRKSLSRPLVFWTGVTLSCFAVFVWVIAKDDARIEELSRDQALPITGTFAGLALIAFAIHFTAIARATRWRSKLPFSIQGFDEVLGGGLSVTEVEVLVYFRDTQPKEDLVLELVKARLGRVDVRAGKASFSILPQKIGRDTTNGPLARWLEKLVSQVLREVHRGYPIDRIELKPLQTQEFFIPVGRRG